MKKLRGLMITVLAVVLLTGCNLMELADGFDKEVITRKAAEEINYLISGDYESCLNMMRDDVKAQITAEVLESSMETMAESTGEFKEIKSTTIIGQKDADTDTDMAIAVVIATFEKRSVTYTITFSTDMEVIGLFMK